MKEVYPGIFSITEKGSFGVIKPPENVYVIAGKDGIIYDAGYGDKKTVTYLVSEIKKIETKFREKNETFDLTRILISHTHPDHFSGLKLIKERLGVKIVLTRKMAEHIKSLENITGAFKTDDEKDYFILKRSLGSRIARKLGRKIGGFFYYKIYGINLIENPDEIIEENSEILINDENWKIFPSPGHSFDHISLYNEKKGILFSGDNVLRSITTWLGPPNCSVEDYVESIESLQELPNLKIILAAHGSPIENPKERVVEILEHRKKREQQVLDLIQENSERGITATEIAKIIYINSKRFIRQMGREWICLTLRMLEEKNLITRDAGKKEFLFFPAV